MQTHVQQTKNRPERSRCDLNHYRLAELATHYSELGRVHGFVDAYHVKGGADGRGVLVVAAGHLVAGLGDAPARTGTVVRMVCQSVADVVSRDRRKS